MKPYKIYKVIKRYGEDMAKLGTEKRPAPVAQERPISNAAGSEMHYRKKERNRKMPLNI